MSLLVDNSDAISFASLAMSMAIIRYLDERDGGGKETMIGLYEYAAKVARENEASVEMIEYLKRMSVNT